MTGKFRECMELVGTRLLHPNPESPFYTTSRRTLCPIMRAGFQESQL